MEGERRLLLAFCLVVVCGVGVMSIGCEPDCTGKPFQAQVPDPRNCSQFYVCGHNGDHSETPLPCEPGNEFPAEAEGCLPIAQPPCTPLCDQSNCRYECDQTLPTDVVASVYNCSTYYMCLPGGTYLMECPPENPNFDGTNCVTNTYSCCDNPCMPYCSTNVLQTYDPADCTKYYVCTEPGPVNENYHVECGSGEHFDIGLATCVSGAECNNVCENGNIIYPGTTAGPGGATTTTTPGGGGGDCVTSFTCPANGYYSMCQITCQQYYFSCSGPGAQGTLQACNGGLVFNTDPAYPYCILPENCPYHPSK